MNEFRQKPIYEEQFYLASQDGTTFLDRFAHCLLVKGTQEMLDTILVTLIRQAQMAGKRQEAEKVIERFVRSVVRVYVGLLGAVGPNGGKKKTVSNSVLRCRRVFQALVTHSVRELAEAADALMVPVRLGIIRPTASFPMVSNQMDAADNCERLFAVDPLTPLNRAEASLEDSMEVDHEFWNAENDDNEERRIMKGTEPNAFFNTLP